MNELTFPANNTLEMSLQNDVPYARYVLFAIIYVPCTIITFIGNIFVLLAYRRDPKIRENTTNAYILNLALADLLVGVVMVIYAPLFFSGRWLLGEKLCVVTWVFDYTTTDMSVITIVAISVDRCHMVQNSLRHRSRQSRRKVAIICGVLWVACLAVHLTLGVTYTARTGYVREDTSQCDLGYRRNLVVVVLMFLFEFLMPALCVLFLNLKVYIHLRGRSATLYTRSILAHQQSHPLPSESRPIQTPSQEVCDMRIHGNTSGSQHQKAAKFLSLLLGVFVVCWLPYYVKDCYTYVHPSRVFNEVLDQIVNLILWANSTINPFLYAFTNVLFKENFMHFLKCKGQK